MGSQRDWIWLFTKQGSDTPVFGLNLALTPRRPLRLRNAICFLFFLPKEGRRASLPQRCNLWSEKKNDMKVKPQLRALDAQCLQLFSGSRLLAVMHRVVSLKTLGSDTGDTELGFPHSSALLGCMILTSVMS